MVFHYGNLVLSGGLALPGQFCREQLDCHSRDFYWYFFRFQNLRMICGIYIVTNDKSQKSSKAAQDASGFRWIIESMHREMKQLTGIRIVNVENSVSNVIILTVHFWFGHF